MASFHVQGVCNSADIVQMQTGKYSAFDVEYILIHFDNPEISTVSKLRLQKLACWMQIATKLHSLNWHKLPQSLNAFIQETQDGICIFKYPATPPTPKLWMLSLSPCSFFAMFKTQ